MAGRIVKIAKGGFQKTAEKDISYYAKNINTNASGSVSETGGDGVMFGSPKSASWEMPDAEFPDYSTSYQKTMPKEVASNSSKVANKSTKTTETNSIEEDESIQTRNVKVTIGIFFDGTLNNRYNTEARWLYEKKKEGILISADEEKKARKYKTWFGGDRSETSSYENDLSNAARLEEFYVDHDLSSQHIIEKIYVEGIGTLDGKGDFTSGFAFGTGKTGVRAKVKEGIKKIGKKLKGQVKDKEIEELTFNVYGFSRGATAARNFVHEVTKEKGDEKDEDNMQSVVSGLLIKPLKTKFNAPYGWLGEQLKANGLKKVHAVKINFAGLFDTVSSHDADGYDSNKEGDWNVHKHDDVDELHLDEINQKAKKIVHFVADDEHRENFSLTTISKGIEKKFPGVHCDIGGSYTNGMEKIDIIDKGYGKEVLKKEKARLVEQGWFLKDQLSLSSSDEIKLKFKLASKRLVLRNYSFIPLEFMAIYSDLQDKIKINKNKLSVQYDLLESKGEFKLSTEQIRLLSAIKERLHNYVFHNDPPIKFYTQTELGKHIEDFDIEQKKKDHHMLFKLRNEFLHFSSKYEKIGYDPRIIEGKRERQIYKG